MQKKRRDRMVEIARFYDPGKARMLESLLKSEGIGCYLRNEYTSQVMYPADMGGIRIELLESDVPRASAVMQANGFGSEDPSEEKRPASALEKCFPLAGGLSAGKQVLVVCVILLVCVYLLLCAGRLLSSL